MWLDLVCLTNPLDLSLTLCSSFNRRPRTSAWSWPSRRQELACSWSRWTENTWSSLSCWLALCIFLKFYRLPASLQTSPSKMSTLLEFNPSWDLLLRPYRIAETPVGVPSLRGSWASFAEQISKAPQPISAQPTYDKQSNYTMKFLRLWMTAWFSIFLWLFFLALMMFRSHLSFKALTEFTLVSVFMSSIFFTNSTALCEVSFQHD